MWALIQKKIVLDDSTSISINFCSSIFANFNSSNCWKKYLIKSIKINNGK